MIKKFIYILIFTLIGTNAVLAKDATFLTYPSFTKNHNKWIVKDVNPGKSYDEYISVVNLSESAITLNLKVVETEGGKEKIKMLEDRDYQNIGKWISPETQQINLLPKEKKAVKISITIPSETPIGEYQGVILVSNLEKNNSSLNIETRIGNRVYLNVTNSNLLESNTFNPSPSLEQILLIFASSLGLYLSIKPRKLTIQKNTI